MSQIKIFYCKSLISIFVLIFIFINPCLIAQKANCDDEVADDREIRIQNQADIYKKRLEIIKAIWNADQIPQRTNVMVTPGIPSPLNPSKYVKKVDKFEIPVQLASGPDTVKDLAYFFVPVKRKNRLVMICPGHTCTIKTQPGKSQIRVEETIIGLLRSGFDVLSVYMPHVSETNCNLKHCDIMNTDLGIENHKPTYGLRLFLDPTIVSLNYLLQQNKYKDVNMVGLSGGGWTTNLIAAIDPRIEYSFSVAGSTPLFYRGKSSIGDIEQFIPQLYRDIAGYPDLYILGAYGKGRKQVQILNSKDDCCFGIKQHKPGREYYEDMRTYEKNVSDRLTSLQAKGQYYLVIDEIAPNHQISEYALEKVILPELKKK
jgi:hypothetical protein